MDFGHDTEIALATLVELVNTAPGTGGSEGLPDVASLQSFVSAQRISEVGQLGDDDIVAVHRLRGRLHEIFAAPDEPTAIERVNALVADARTTPRLTRHQGWPLHIHYFAPGASLAEHLAADGGMALALVLVGGGRDRLRTCAAPGCARVLVDLSRNRSRRYCDSRTCGNRLHVAAYRARRRAG